MRNREAQRKERVDRIRETQRRGRSLPPPSLAKPKNRDNNSSGVEEEEKGSDVVPQRRRAAPRPFSTGSAPPVLASARNPNPKAVPSRFAAAPRKRVVQGGSKRAGNGTVASPTLSSSPSLSKATRGPSTAPKGRSSARSQSTPPTSARQPSGASSKATRSPQSRTAKSSVSTKSKSATKQPRDAVSQGAVAKRTGAVSAKRVATPPLPSPPPRSTQNSRKSPAKKAGTPDTKEDNAPPAPPAGSNKASEMTTDAPLAATQGQAASASPAVPPSPPAAEERVSTPDTHTDSHKGPGRLAALEQVLESSAITAVAYTKRVIGVATPEEGSPTSEVQAEAVPDPAKTPTLQVDPGSEGTENQQSMEPDADAVSPSPEGAQEIAEMSIAERIAKLKSGRNRRTAAKSGVL